MRLRPLPGTDSDRRQERNFDSVGVPLFFFDFLLLLLLLLAATSFVRDRERSFHHLDGVFVEGGFSGLLVW